MSPNYLVWDDKVVTALKEHFHKRISAMQIAWIMSGDFDLKITKNAVIGKLHRLGLHSRPQGAPRPVHANEKRGRPRRTGRFAGGLFTPGPARPLRFKISEPEFPKPVCAPVSLFDLKTRHCRWIVSEVGEPVLFCGAEQFNSEAAPRCWCTYHWLKGTRNNASARARVLSAAAAAIECAGNGERATAGAEPGRDSADDRANDLHAGLDGNGASADAVHQQAKAPADAGEGAARQHAPF